jgi:hypothetical protein
MVSRFLHDAVFEPSIKVDTPAQSKLNGILRNSEVSQILRVAVDDDDEEWFAQPWKIPDLQIWAKMYHKYEGMTDMLTGTMMVASYYHYLRDYRRTSSSHYLRGGSRL